MAVYLDKHAAIDNEKIAFTAHPVNGKVVLVATLEAAEFEELAALGVLSEDMEDDGHGEPENHD